MFTYIDFETKAKKDVSFHLNVVSLLLSSLNEKIETDTFLKKANKTITDMIGNNHI